MPIHCPIATQGITQDEFKQIAGQVMQHVFPARLTELRHPTIVDERWDSRATGADSFERASCH